MRVSVGLPVRPGVTSDEIARCAETAERLGCDAVNLTDHPAPPDSWLQHGGHHTLDPFVGLAIAAAATSTLRLHTNVVILGYRNPHLLAKSVTSLDSLSGGRFVLGVGVGYLREEFEMLGADFDGRGRIADETLATLRTAVGDDVPIWVGGNSRAATRRAVEHGNGWAPMPSSAALSKRLGTPGLDDVGELATRISAMHELAAERGREDRLDVVMNPPSLSGFARERWQRDQVLEEIAALTDAGVTGLGVELGTSDPSQWVDEVERLAGDVLSKI